jgi:hypothetical protein
VSSRKRWMLPLPMLDFGVSILYRPTIIEQ